MTSLGTLGAAPNTSMAHTDPKTGQNRSISTTFRMEALPAYLLTTEGKVIATPEVGESAPKSAAERQ